MKNLENKIIYLNIDRLNDLIKKLDLKSNGTNLGKKINIENSNTIGCFFKFESKEVLRNCILNFYNFFLPIKCVSDYSLDLILDLLYRTDEHSKQFEILDEYYCNRIRFYKNPKFEFKNHKEFSKTFFDDEFCTAVEINDLTEVWELYNTDILSRKIKERLNIEIMPKTLNRLYVVDFLDIIYKTEYNSTFSREISHVLINFKFCKQANKFSI